MHADPSNHPDRTQANGLALGAVQPDLLAKFFAGVIRLAAALKQIGLEGGGVAVLQILKQQGPQTVPQIARIRATSRQNIQMLVNGLEREDCVELRSNPAHKRSALVCLTTKGQALLAKETGREDLFLARLAPHLSETGLAAASDLVGQVVQLLSAEAVELPPPIKGRVERWGEGAPPIMEGGQPESSELPISLL